MFCSKCGTEIKQGARYCGNCGCKVGEVEIQQNNKENNSQNKIRINRQFISVIIDLIVLVIIIVTMRNVLGIGTGNYKNIVDNYCKSIDSKINYDYDVTISGDTVYVTVKAKDKYTSDLYGSHHIFTINKSSKQIVSAPFEKIKY